MLIDRESGTAHLTDFGVARALEATDDRMTGTGLIVGSPRYMSPEQAAGDRALDGRSDIYSLGLVGYEMLAGEPTFSGASPVSVIAKQITEVPPPVATRADGVPPALAHAIDRAVAKDPNERWPDAGAMAAALRDADPTHIPRSAPVARRWAGRRRRLALVAGALVAVLIAAGVWATYALRGAPPRGRAAEIHLRRALRDSGQRPRARLASRGQHQHADAESLRRGPISPSSITSEASICCATRAR